MANFIHQLQLSVRKLFFRNSIVLFLLLGNNVTIPGEVVVLNAVVLPHKELGSSSKNQIIL